MPVDYQDAGDFIKDLRGGKRDFRGAYFREGMDLSGHPTFDDLTGYLRNEIIECGLKTNPVNLTDASMVGLKARGLIIPRLIATRVQLVGANLQNASLTYGDFEDADFTESQLSGADLSEARFIDAYMLRVGLVKSFLDRASFRGANLDRAYMMACRADGADFSYAKMKRADLTEASLVAAILQNADLTDADISKADMRGTRMREARLVRAKLVDVKNLETSEDLGCALFMDTVIKPRELEIIEGARSEVNLFNVIED